MDVVLSTRSLTKAAQVKQNFFGNPVNVITLDEAGIDGDPDIPGGTPPPEAARKRAQFAFARVRPFTWAMGEAEDREAGDTVVLVIDPDAKEHFFRGPFQGVMRDVLQHLVRTGAAPVSY